jgi:hypothetical protein
MNIYIYTHIYKHINVFIYIYIYVYIYTGGLTNKEKLRKKNFVMVRKGKKSVNNKIRKV